MEAAEVLHFWFEEIDQASWWKVDPAFDARIRERFQGVHKKTAACELSTWRETPDGRLAEIIILDQFSRNMFRDQPLAFAHDPLALTLAQEAITAGAAMKLPPVRCAFLYLPFMHSESKLIHEQAVRLFSEKGLEDNLAFEMKHKAIIDRFGRYPHRNKILGRLSTPEELEFLKGPNSAF